MAEHEIPPGFTDPEKIAVVREAISSMREDESLFIGAVADLLEHHVGGVEFMNEPERRASAGPKEGPWPRVGPGFRYVRVAEEWLDKKLQERLEE